MGKLSREKGANFERRIARWLNDQVGLRYVARAEFARQTDESQQGNKGDVRDLTGRVPLVVQAKHQKTPSPWRAIQEAEEAASKAMSRGGRLDANAPMACVRRHGGEDIVVIRPSLFATLCYGTDETFWDVFRETWFFEQSLDW